MPEPTEATPQWVQGSLKEREHKMFRIKKGPKSAQTRFVLIGLIPMMGFFLVVTVFPVFAGIVLAFFRYNLLQTHPTTFLGLGNFKKILSDWMFWLSLKNTLFYVAVIVPNILVCSLLVALAISPLGRKSKGLYRAFYFTPCITSLVTVTLVWRFIYLPTGLLNSTLSAVGLPTKAWLGNIETLPWAVGVMMVWQQLGYAIILFLAGLDGVPGMLYEAAEIDGASNWGCFWYITLPLLRPVMLFVTVIMCIWSFKIFAPLKVLWAPAANTVLVLYIYNNAFKYLRLGYGSAIALVLFIIILFFTLIQMRVLRKKWEY